MAMADGRSGRSGRSANSQFYERGPESLHSGRTASARSLRESGRRSQRSNREYGAEYPSGPMLSHRSARSGVSRAKSTSSLRSSVDFPTVMDARATGYLPEVGRFAVSGIPGYCGYVPGKYPENVLGATHQRSNELSLHACDQRAFPEETGAKYNPGGLRTRDGYNVPGYTGFVPGKYADNVHGHVFARTNQISKVIKGEQSIDRAAWRVPRYGHPDGVLGHSGYYSAYTQGHDTGAHV